VELVELVSQFSELEMEILRENFDPLTPCDDYGVELYLEVKDYLLSLH
jgi:hypothetical protein